MPLSKKLLQSRIASDLKDLRDQSVFSFFMVNALFVVIVFLLQLNKDKLHIRWPFGVKTNITFNESTQEVRNRVKCQTCKCRAYWVESLSLVYPAKTNVNMRPCFYSKMSTDIKPKNKTKTSQKINRIKSISLQTLDPSVNRYICISILRVFVALKFYLECPMMSVTQNISSYQVSVFQNQSDSTQAPRL